jgi:hypothetical protein
MQQLLVTGSSLKRDTSRSNPVSIYVNISTKIKTLLQLVRTNAQVDVTKPRLPSWAPSHVPSWAPSHAPSWATSQATSQAPSCTPDYRPSPAPSHSTATSCAPTPAAQPTHKVSGLKHDPLTHTDNPYQRAPRGTLTDINLTAQLKTSLTVIIHQSRVQKSEQKMSKLGSSQTGLNSSGVATSSRRSMHRPTLPSLHLMISRHRVPS